MLNIDLHSLRVLDEIYKTGSLSRTAVHLGLTQPAISISLTKLRRHFDDALFVRVGNVMKPTPQAEGLMDNVRAALAALESTLAYRLDFDPATTDRTFRIAMTDIGQIVILPAMLDVLKREAPFARLQVSNVSDRTPQSLEAGELDLALGFIPQIPEAFFQQALFRERFACLCRVDHPRVAGPPTLAQFEQESHVLIETSGTGHLIIERTLEGLRIDRRIAVTIPNFLGLATIVGHTDYLCTLPRKAALIMARGGEVAAHDLPFDLPDYTVRQHWHERQARDPGNRWLRSVMSSLFSSGESDASGRVGKPTG